MVIMLEGQKVQFMVPENQEDISGLSWKECQGKPFYEKQWLDAGQLVTVHDPSQIGIESSMVSLAYRASLISCPLLNDKGEVQVEKIQRDCGAWQNDTRNPERKIPVITGATFSIRPSDPDLSFEEFSEFSDLVRQTLKRGI